MLLVLLACSLLPLHRSCRCFGHFRPKCDRFRKFDHGLVFGLQQPREPADALREVRVVPFAFGLPANGLRHVDSIGSSDDILRRVLADA